MYALYTFLAIIAQERSYAFSAETTHFLNTQGGRYGFDVILNVDVGRKYAGILSIYLHTTESSSGLHLLYITDPAEIFPLRW